MPDITIDTSDGGYFGYLASPASGTGPGVLVIQEIFGVNADMRAHCDRLANEGYLALCPDLFWRQEPGVQITDQTDEEWQKAFELYQGFDVEKGIEDLKASLSQLRNFDGCSGKIGTVSFCLGGLLAYLMATRSDADCNVSYYGVGIEEQLDETENIIAPTVLNIAEEDDFVSKEVQATIREGLDDHPHVTIHSYPNVNHAFARNGGVNYNEAAAKLADSRTTEAFKANLS
jgi:carboxymethylenebutenolidase|tara:strand:- start:1903 stop:2595 length:693 start_codon:yes stop_codon:yes gene_type:complete